MGRVLPILFNTEMVWAILDGRKTVTRRVVKHPFEVHPNGYITKPRGNERLCPCEPPYQPGDILYVRETWCEWTDGYLYKAGAEGLCQPGAVGLFRWRPSIHMPKQAARIWLRVTEVWVERLQDMTGQDILREGVNCHVHPEADYFDGNQKMMFAELWDSTVNKPDLDRYGWDANPWVWVIEFARCEKSEDGRQEK